MSKCLPGDGSGGTNPLLTSKPERSPRPGPRRNRIPQVFGKHKNLSARLKKTLYYGNSKTMDSSSLHLTELAVDSFSRELETGFGSALDMDYASSICYETCVTPCSIILGMTYLNHLTKENPQYIHKISSSRLFLVSMMMASKFLYDEGEDDEVLNSEWATSSGLHVDEVNTLEREFLHAIDWRLWVPPGVWYDLLRRTEARIAFQEGKQRGWYSFTDITTLQSATTWEHFTSHITKILCGCLMVYSAGLLTLVTTAHLLSTTLPTALTVAHMLSTGSCTTGLEPTNTLSQACTLLTTSPLFTPPPEPQIHNCTFADDLELTEETFKKLLACEGKEVCMNRTGVPLPLLLSQPILLSQHTGTSPDYLLSAG